jgi:hypothetical protein
MWCVKAQTQLHRCSIAGAALLAALLGQQQVPLECRWVFCGNKAALAT